ncbi:hypothetical protein D3C87_1835910 [compost metagenome]
MGHGFQHLANGDTGILRLMRIHDLRRRGDEILVSLVASGSNPFLERGIQWAAGFRVRREIDAPPVGGLHGRG